MIPNLKLLFCSIFVCFTLVICSAQTDGTPVTWHVFVDKDDQGNHNVKFEAFIENGWVIYGMNTPEGGPLPTSFSFEEGANIKIEGITKEITKAESKYEPLFEIDVLKHSTKAEFLQTVRKMGDSEILNGMIRYMACNGQNCLPPTNVPFIAQLK